MFVLFNKLSCNKYKKPVHCILYFMSIYINRAGCCGRGAYIQYDDAYKNIILLQIYNILVVKFKITYIFKLEKEVI